MKLCVPEVKEVPSKRKWVSEVSKPMQILAIAYYFPPCRSSGSIRNLKILKELGGQHCEVNVLTVKTKYFLNGAAGGGELMRQVPLQIKIFRTPCFHIREWAIRAKQWFRGEKLLSEQNIPAPPRGNDMDARSGSITRWSRIKDFITDLLALPDESIGWFPFALLAGFRAMWFGRPDLIYAIGKPWTALLIGLTLKLVSRRPLVVDFMDPWLGNTMSPTKALSLEKVERFMEWLVLRWADFVVANTAELAQDLANRYPLVKDKCAVIPCGYDEEDFRKDLGQPVIKTNSKGKFIVTHIGSFYYKRSPVNFLKAVKLLFEKQLINPNDFAVNFIGVVAEEDPELNALLKDPALQKCISNSGWVSHGEAIATLFFSDVLLLIQPETLLQIPAKLYEYVATEKPILALCHPKGAVASILKRENWGTPIDNDDIPAITDALWMYIKLQHAGLIDRKRCSAIDSYSVQSLAKNLHDIFATLILKEPSKL